MEILVDLEVVEQERALVVVAEQLVKEIMEEQEQEDQRMEEVVAVELVLQDQQALLQMVETVVMD